MILDDSPAFPATFLGAMRIGAVPVPVNPMDRVDNYVYYLDDSYARCWWSRRRCCPALEPELESRAGLHVLVVDGDPGPHASFDAVVREHAGRWRVATAGGHPPRGHGVLALQLGLDRPAEGRRPRAPRHRRDRRAVRAQRPADLRARRVLLDDEAVPCLRPRERPDISAVGGGVRRVGQGPLGPGPDLRRCHPLPADAVLLGPGAVRGDGQGARGRGRRLLDRARVRVGGRGAARRRCSRGGRRSPACRSSTGSARPRCSTSTARTRSPIWRPGRPDDRCRDTSCGWSTSADSTSSPGEAGDLMVRGDSCAAFYWHQREKTRHSMRGEWFHTGDRYIVDADGHYVYQGRSDDMIKVGGLWVSPADVEGCLVRHPAVSEAAVIGVHGRGRQPDQGVRDLRRAPDDPDALADELREWCKEHLRRYEYPHVVEFVEDLPRTPTGKVQRYKLREAERSGRRWRDPRASHNVFRRVWTVPASSSPAGAGRFPRTSASGPSSTPLTPRTPRGSPMPVGCRWSCPARPARPCSVALLLALADGLLAHRRRRCRSRVVRRGARERRRARTPRADDWELALIAAAREPRCRRSAICRGAQLLAIAHGGRLAAASVRPATATATSTGSPRTTILSARHRVELVAGLAGRAGASSGESRIAVNTIHHHEIADPGELEVTATAPGRRDRGGRAANRVGLRRRPVASREDVRARAGRAVRAARCGRAVAVRGCRRDACAATPRRCRPDGRAGIVPPPPWHYSGDFLIAEYRTDPDAVAALLPAELEPAEDPGRGRRDLRRLAVVLGRHARARGPDPVPVPRVLPRRRRSLQGRAGQPLRLHLGRQGLRDVSRLDPGLPQEARLDPHDAAVRGRQGDAAAGAGRALRRDLHRERPADRAYGGHARARLARPGRP